MTTEREKDEPGVARRTVAKNEQTQNDDDMRNDLAIFAKRSGLGPKHRGHCKAPNQAQASHERKKLFGARKRNRTGKGMGRERTGARLHK